MEITCERCQTTFGIDPGPAASDVEAVCPGCFHVRHIQLSSFSDIPSNSELKRWSHQNWNPGGLADVGWGQPMRKAASDAPGVIASFDVRHSAWLETRKMNPFEIKRFIYQGLFDGGEEYLTPHGQWKSIREYPAYAFVLQLTQKNKASSNSTPESAATRSFIGWKAVAKAPATIAFPVAPPPLSAVAEARSDGTLWRVIAAVVILALVGLSFLMF